MEIAVEARKWLLLEVLQEATSYLKAKQIENPRLNAELLLAHVLGLTRIDLYLRFEQPLEREEREAYRVLLKRRGSHEPIQYLTGKTEFMSLPFIVTPDVLIPRPETEVLIENAIKQIPRVFDSKKEFTCLDIGTGCGNIAVSLSKYVDGLNVVAVDVSPSAVALARQNADVNQVGRRIDFRIMDVMEPDFAVKIDSRFDVIVMNPPYVTSDEYQLLSEEIRKYEPRSALEAGADGLLYYRRLGEIMPLLLSKPGLALLEIGESQSECVRSIFSNSHSYEIETIQDYNDRDRVLMLKNL